MNEFEIFDKESKVIAESENYYLVTNNKSTTINDGLELVTLVDQNGKYYTEPLPIDYFFRDDLIDWEPVEKKYSDCVHISKNDFTKDSLIGLATGDALGVPVEFLSKDVIQQIQLKDMVGKDTNFLDDPLVSNYSKISWSSKVPSGTWSDDTSLIVASMATIVKDEGVINYDHILDSFLNWWEKGEYCAIDNFSFGLGRCTSAALDKFHSGVPALDCGGDGIKDNGNGSLMRILPFSLYAISMGYDEEQMVDFINKASSITHAHDISKMSCFIYTEFLKVLLITKNPDLAYKNLLTIPYYNYYSREAIDAHKELFNVGFMNRKDSSFPEKNGYVVTTLEISIHNLLTTDNYESAVLQAINYGYDTDTNAAVTGSLAGALYGYQNIPERWRSKLRKLDQLEELVQSFNNTLNKLEKKTLNFKNQL